MDGSHHNSGLIFETYHVQVYALFCAMVEGREGAIRMSLLWSFRWSSSVFVNSFDFCELF